ncbi:glycoside hydrolase family 18 protein [Nocardiopsis sp. NPDC049922]|uniref:glycoside hydrolase family 18 protein n=1 Tax=Nocardiopsis sp. NPDC049922 TaxID=3155157 RepID=UPI0033C3E2C2
MQVNRSSPARPRPRRHLPPLAAAVAVVALVATGLVLLGGREPERVAYVAGWNVADRGFTVADVAASGAPEHLTRLMWAFGDVSEDGLCHIPSGRDDQPWELYQRPYTAEESVDGRADRPDQDLAGSLHQLRLLREDHPHLGASLSLGGWSWSTYLSVAARTPESREAFVASCLDLWIRGDLPVLDGGPQGGEGAAAGVFDGVDLDWEWPGGQGDPGNVVHSDDPANLTALVAEFRRQLDALGEETGAEYTLSVSLPGGAEPSTAYEAELFDLVDFATVQGYDFAGPWNERTAHHSNLYAPAHDPGADSVDRAVQRYLDLGADPSRLVVGVPAFGRGWQGVGAQDAGRGQVAGAPADDAYDGPTMAFADLEERDGRRFLDEEAGAYWIYDGDTWWTYDNADVIALKGEYVRDRGLGGLMVWNLDMDPEGELVRAMDESLE